MSTIPPVEPSSSDVTAPAANPDELAQLRELTRSLLVTAQALQAQSARSAAIQDVIGDVRAATRAIVSGPATTHNDLPAGKEPCGGSPCDCVSESCCVFDVIMTHVRVVDMQIEPVDSNIAPFFNMEVRMFASINGYGVVIPSLFGYLSLHKLINKPGVWSQVQRSIGLVTVTKGQPKTITISVDAMELEDGEPTALRDEYGTASATMTLDCCCSTAPVISFELDFTGGGQGGGTIETKFTAIRRC